jgi:hypothetical protein
MKWFTSKEIGHKYHMQIQIIELEIKEISAPFHLGESEVSRAKGVPCLSLNMVASHCTENKGTRIIS